MSTAPRLATATVFDFQVCVLANTMDLTSFFKAKPAVQAAALAAAPLALKIGGGSTKTPAPLLAKTESKTAAVAVSDVLEQCTSPVFSPVASIKESAAAEDAASGFDMVAQIEAAAKAKVAAMEQAAAATAAGPTKTKRPVKLSTATR